MKEEERRRAWDLTGEAEREARANRRAGKVEAKPEEVETIDPARWSDLVYNYGGNSNPSAPAGVDPTALELYAKYPLFVRAPSSSSTSPSPPMKSNASLATSYAPTFGLVTSTSASKSASIKSATTSVSGNAHSGASALTLLGVDPALYASKRHAAPRHVLAKGVERKLLMADVLLRPTHVTGPTSFLSPKLTLKYAELREIEAQSCGLQAGTARLPERALVRLNDSYAYLKGLFSFEAKEALERLRKQLKKVLEDLRNRTIESNACHQATLKDFLRRPTIVKELASTLNMQLSSIKSWSWRRKACFSSLGSI
ncbi:hypothetical protein DFH11DRAFT_1818304 [Phellopilus nigrolimitatus]|nr:hypothetical protein DFH11DRAFT_1818304 [Phellopilus nigrolimitatus]